MIRCMVIGLGNFGFNTALTLAENGVDVLGIDVDKNTIQRAKEFLAQGIIGDASNRSVLSTLSPRDFDVAVVSIGQEMATSILISLYLKEMGTRRIVARAVSEDHSKILKMIGVSDIVFPEKDMAMRIGRMLSTKNTLDYMPLSKEYAIMEVNPPKSFIGKTIKDLQISTRFGCNVLGLRYPEESINVIEGYDSETRSKIAPTADEIIPKGCVMIVLGRHSDIEKIQSLD